MDRLLNLIKTDNEENAILCVKICLDFAKYHQKSLSDRMQPFLDIIGEFLESFEALVKDTFNNPTQAGHPSVAAVTVSSPRPASPAVQTTVNGGEEQAVALLPSLQSFKVMAEFPITVVSLFQIHRDLVQTNIRKFAPLLRGVLTAQAPPQEQAHADALAQGKNFYGVAKDVKNRAAYGEFINVQVKTMSFLAYVLRGYANQLQDFIPTLPSVMIRLLRDCPRERATIRKELLVAIRHIINFNFRKVFLKCLGDFLDERTLLGDGLAAQETQQAIAYSTIADLLHHLRESLTPDQICLTVQVYSKNLRKPFPGTNFALMSSKLLFNTAEYIGKMEDKQAARYYLMMILEAVADKLASMNRQFENAVKVSSHQDSQAGDFAPNEYLAVENEPPDWDETEIFNTTPIKQLSSRDGRDDPVSDNKTLFKQLVNGLKSIVYQLRICNPAPTVDPGNAPPNHQEVASGFSAEEVELFTKVFHEGIQIFRYYPADNSSTENQNLPIDHVGSHHVIYNKEEKEMLETFATIFHHIDPAVFHEVFCAEIPHMYEMMFDHPSLLQVPQFLLASEATSPGFAGMLLHFLMDKLEDVGTADVKKANLLLRLFKLAFMAVTLFSSHNEQVLLPHVNKLVTQSIKLSTVAEAPMHYFYLLRSLFRSIGGGRFEHLYKEILPLLEMLLEVLNNLIAAARKPQERDLFVELSLTVPARLSNLLPHLSYLMKPLVLALRASTDLVGQGLRTLELCVDNLTSDYLDPIMAPVIDELMTGLYEHLRPAPYSHFHAHTTMRILGKLGGRNRRYLSAPPTLNYEKTADRQPHFEIKLFGSSNPCSFPVRIGLDVAIERIYEIPRQAPAKASDLIHKQQALKLIMSEVKLILGTDSLPENFAQLVRLQANDLFDQNTDNGTDLNAQSDKEYSVIKRDAQQDTLRELLNALFFAASVPEIKEDAAAFLSELYRHFIILEIGRALAAAKQERKVFSADAGEINLIVDHRVIVDSIICSLSSDRLEVREIGEAAIIAMRDAATTVFGSEEKGKKLPLFSYLLLTCCHSCHQEEWFTKAGGILGLHIMASSFEPDGAWLAERQLEMCRALLYAARDLPDDIPKVTRTQALDTLNEVIQYCNTSLTREEVLTPNGKVHSLCAFLIYELSSSSPCVREAAQSALTVLAGLASVEVHTIVAPLKSRVLVHVFSKPLRSVLVPIQIGYIEAITYCLQLGNGIIGESVQEKEQFQRFMREIILLLDHDDIDMTNRPADQRNAENVVKLRISCLQLLSLTLYLPDFNTTAADTRPRHRIVTQFFKCLYKNSSEVVHAANEALKVVVAQDAKLPKDILQSGLKPILVSLQDPTKLTLEGLDCLSRLLQLLKNYFKVEIGSRLLDNINVIASSEILQKASFMLIEQHMRIKMVAAIFNIFSLLPDAAKDFMGNIMSRTIELEQQLRRTHFSPLRAPLVRYLNRFAQEAWDELYDEQIQDQNKGRFFAQLLADKKSESLRDCLQKDAKRFIETITAEREGPERWFAIINAIHITESVSFYPEICRALFEQEGFKNMLLGCGKSLSEQLQDDQLEMRLRLPARQALSRLMRICSTYLAQKPDDLDFLFDVIHGVTSDELQDKSNLLQRTIYNELVSSKDIELWRTAVNRCIELYAAKDSSDELKAFVIHNIVNPILATDVQRNWTTIMQGAKGTDFVNKALLDSISTSIWQPLANISTNDELSGPNTDRSRMEMLQMTTLLLKYHHAIMESQRKVIIRWAWVWIKFEDAHIKHASYVVLAYFLKYYTAPAKISSQIYFSLVRASTPEARPLVVQALEVLAPALPTRLDPPEDGALPQVIRIARKPILEDPFNLQQTQNILYFIARHPDLFYEGRDTLSTMIIQAIFKIAAVPSGSIETKKSALNLIGLISKWEERWSQEYSVPQTGEKRNADGTSSSPRAETKPVSFIASGSLRLMLIKYLVQFISTLAERYPLPSAKLKEGAGVTAIQQAQSSDISKRAFELFHSLLTRWTDIDINAMFPKITDAVLIPEPKQDDKYELSLTRIINVLQVVAIMVDVKPDEWVLARLPQLRKLLERSIKNPHPEVQDCLYTAPDDRRSMIVRILQAAPEEIADEEGDEEERPASDFVKFLSDFAGQCLTEGNFVAGINILLAFAKCIPEKIDTHVPAVMKAMNHALKEHQAPSNNAAQLQMAVVQSGRDHGHGDMHATEAQVDLILKIIDLLSSRMAELADNRRPFLSALNTLVDRSPSPTVCNKILDLTSGWIFTPNQGFPTVKERVAVVLKMITLEQRPDPTLFARFLQLIIRVYEDSKITRSELAIRLEPAFLIGTRAQDIDMRSRFMTLFDRHLTRTASKRILYLLAAQNWDVLQDSFWLNQVIQLLFGTVDVAATAALHKDDFKTLSLAKAFGTYAKDSRIGDVILEDEYETFMAGHAKFCKDVAEVRVRDILDPLCLLQHTDAHVARSIWATMFPQFWSILSKDERGELRAGMIALLTKDFHSRQVDKRPNCVQALLEGVARTENPRMNFPHHLMKFLARTYDAWYIALSSMERSAVDPILDTAAVRESNQDALAETYAGLQEDDLFYGLWRKRCAFLDTNTALSYEQHGEWEKSQRMYENATFKARTGNSPFTQGEYMLWEDHWILCAQKLQQWDILCDFAKVDNLNDLFLDSVWRNLEYWTAPEHVKQLDNIVKGVSDALTPRRAFFGSFMSLLKLQSEQESQQAFQRLNDEAVQLSIRKWHQLPKRITNAHVPVLQHFQQLVELHDASVIINSLSQTTAQNLEQKSPELKLLLSTWRDRLPNFWDDINAWQELVTWRQHIFLLINKKYLSLVPAQGGNVSGNSLAYRGYHETASIINRFAHVARKHNLPEVCINQLSKIYTLPNIEIQEAFLKLREQAKCHYQNPAELQVGLDVINNTNLNYFGAQQKAEFYTLKGMFLAKQKNEQDANDAFGSALYFDLKLPKAWAEWARYSDHLFKEDPTDLSKAANAISCYLEAANTYKSGKSRKLLSRVLWLLSLDDAEGTLVKSFKEVKGETPIWYWITFIPQLLTSLARPEANVSHQILLKIAKQYPQALYFHLRTSREDYQAIKKQQEAKDVKDKETQAAKDKAPATPKSADGATTEGKKEDTVNPATGAVDSKDANADGAASAGANAIRPPKPDSAEQTSQGSRPVSNSNSNTNGNGTSTETTQPTQESQGPKADDQEQPAIKADQSSTKVEEEKPLKPWEYMESIVTQLKTSFPLLALSLESMVDQISRNFKCPPDEDAYRLIVALLNDALGWVSRTPLAFAKGVKLPSNTEGNITRFAESVLPPHIRKSFEADFVTAKPMMLEYVHTLRRWRDRFEEKLDRRRAYSHLESYGPMLSGFKFEKFDEVEVPGQYLLHKDTNKDFIRIEKFMPDVDLVRGIGVSYRRLKIRGHDGSVHAFAIQHPAARTSRREEKMLQMCRFINDVLEKKKESRRRSIQFLLPAIVPLTPSVRMVQDDESYITLQGVYEDYCRRKRIEKDAPVLYTIEKLRDLQPVSPQLHAPAPTLANLQQRTPDQGLQIRVNAFEAIQERLIPNHVLLDYVQATYPNFADFWLFRRQFAYQLAGISFLTYILHMRDRNPARLNIARSTGNIWGSEFTPSFHPQRPMFHNNEAVPFRLTPNLQMLLGPIALEGIFSASMLVIAKALTEPDATKLEQQLSIFIRDEITFHLTAAHRPNLATTQLRECVTQNAGSVMNRAKQFSMEEKSGSLPANQSVLDVIARSVDPRKLAQMDPLWMPYL